MSYWDTSSLAKLVVAESDSPVFQSHAANISGELKTLEFTRLELWSVLRRKEAERLIHPGEARQLLLDYDAGVASGSCLVVGDSTALRLEYEAVIERCLAEQPPVFIRTLDALHLAGARVAGEKEFVATDRRQRTAVVLLGFALFPPEPPL